MELTTLAVYAVVLLLVLLMDKGHTIQIIAILGSLVMIYEYIQTALSVWVEYVRPPLIQILRSTSVKYGTLILLMCGFIYFVFYLFNEMVSQVENQRFWNYKYKDVQFVKRLTKEQYQEQAEHYTRQKLDELRDEIEHNYY